MSLEQQVTALVEASNNLTNTVNNKIGEIDQKVDDATSSVPDKIREEMSKRVYVNAVNGSDSNQGTQSSPFKTLQHAFNVIATAGYGSIDVLSDITVTSILGAGEKSIIVNLNGNTMTMRNGAVSGSNFRVDFRYGKIDIQDTGAEWWAGNCMCIGTFGVIRFGAHETASSEVEVTCGVEYFIAADGGKMDCSFTYFKGISGLDKTGQAVTPALYKNRGGQFELFKFATSLDSGFTLEP